MTVLDADSAISCRLAFSQDARNCRTTGATRQIARGSWAIPVTGGPVCTLQTGSFAVKPGVGKHQPGVSAMKRETPPIRNPAPAANPPGAHVPRADLNR